MCVCVGGGCPHNKKKHTDGGQVELPVAMIFSGRHVGADLQSLLKLFIYILQLQLFSLTTKLYVVYNSIFVTRY